MMKMDIPIPIFPKGSSNSHPNQTRAAIGSAVVHGARRTATPEKNVPPVSYVPIHTAIGRLSPHRIAPTTATPNAPKCIAANEYAMIEMTSCVICQ